MPKGANAPSSVEMLCITIFVVDKLGDTASSYVNTSFSSMILSISSNNNDHDRTTIPRLLSKARLQLVFLRAGERPNPFNAGSLHISEDSVPFQSSP